MDFSQIGKKIKTYWLEMEKIDKLIILVLIFSFLARIAFLFYSPLRGWDETVYLNLGHDLSTNPLFYSLKNAGWNDFIPSNDVIYGWPNIGFRAPLLPYIISVFYVLNLNFLIPIIIPLFGTLSVFLVYILGKKLFDKKIGLYSAILFALIPTHVFYSGKIWTDPLVVFFILLTFISFWEGYEKENKKHKILFGLFLALSLLARYTTLWIAPIFIFYFLIRDKSLRFLKDKYLWYAIGIFFLILIPWFIYGFIYYGNPLGGFIHGFKAASYWGGVQSWAFFFENSWRIFSAIGVLFIISFFYIFFKKAFLKREIYLLLIWIVFFSVMVMAMPHKEDRFIMLIIPAVCLISGFFITKIKKYRNIIFGLICIVLLFSLGNTLKAEYENGRAEANSCFMEGNKFLALDSIDKNSLVINNQSPIVHFYTKKEVKPYPSSWDLKVFKNYLDLNYFERKIYIFYANYDMQDEQIKKDLTNNFEKVFECLKGWSNATIYKYGVEVKKEVTTIDPIVKQVSKMSLDEKIGQLLIIGFPHNYLDSHIESMIKKYHIGGINLLARNIKDRFQITKLNSDLQKISTIPLFIATDQEGGTTIRFRFLQELDSQLRIKTVEAGEGVAYSRAKELKALGINMNFSPVVDYVSNPKSYLYKRTFGATPEITGELGSAMINGYQKGGVIPVAKHFPGYGNLVVDPHRNISLLQIDKEELETNLISFKKVLANQNTGAIMTAHIVIPSVDSEPATLSYKFITEILRNQFGFDGVIITDDIEMVSAGKKVEEIALESILAGNDIIIDTYTPENGVLIFSRLKKAVFDKEISEERIDQSVIRILKLKANLIK